MFHINIYSSVCDLLISVAAVRLAASRLGQAAALGQLGSKWKAELA